MKLILIDNLYQVDQHTEEDPEFINNFVNFFLEGYPREVFGKCFMRSYGVLKNNKVVGGSSNKVKEGLLIVYSFNEDLFYAITNALSFEEIRNGNYKAGAQLLNSHGNYLDFGGEAVYLKNSKEETWLKPKTEYTDVLRYARHLASIRPEMVREKFSKKENAEMIEIVCYSEDKKSVRFFQYFWFKDKELLVDSIPLKNYTISLREILEKHHFL